MSDPALATMAPEEIRARLHWLPDIQCCAHWGYADLAREAQAHGHALQALDQWPDADEQEFADEMPKEASAAEIVQLRRETLLHREVKAILTQASKLLVPGFDARCTSECCP